jgi:hypothetical protein
MLTPRGTLAGPPTVTLQGFDAPPALVAELSHLVEQIVAAGAYHGYRCLLGNFLT